MSAQHTPGRLVEDTRGPRADIRSESGRIVAVTYGLGFPKTAEGLEKRTKEDRANRRRLVACWNACDGIDTYALDLMTGDLSIKNQITATGKAHTKPTHRAVEYRRQRDDLLAALEQIERLGREADGNLVDVRAMLGDIARAAIAKVKGGAA